MTCFHPAHPLNRSDAFMVGATAVGLRFCRPFLGAPDKQAGALAHLDPAYYRRQVGSGGGQGWQGCQG